MSTTIENTAKELSVQPVVPGLNASDANEHVKPITIIEPSNGLRIVDWKELIAYRDLFSILDLARDQGSLRTECHWNWLGDHSTRLLNDHLQHSYLANWPKLVVTELHTHYSVLRRWFLGHTSPMQSTMELRVWSAKPICFEKSTFLAC